MILRVPYLLIITILVIAATGVESARHGGDVSVRCEVTEDFGSFTACDGPGCYGEPEIPLSNSLNLLYEGSAHHYLGTGGKHNTETGTPAALHFKTLAGQYSGASLIHANIRCRGACRILHCIGRLNI